MLRKCYGCNKELTLYEAMKGQAIFHWIESDPREFAGWVHCRGEDSQFVMKGDTELEELCKQMGVDLCEGTPHTCNKCVRELASMEGIEVPKSVIKGEDFIYRCPKCKSLHVSVYSHTLTRFVYINGVPTKTEAIGIDSAYLVQCDSSDGKCDYRVDITNDQSSDEFRDYETEIV